MTRLLLTLSIRARLVLVALVPLVVAGLIGALALAGSAAENRSRDALVVADDLLHQSLEVKYDVADWNGWQTAYGFDALRGVPDAAADTGSSRSAFLKSGQLVHRDLDRLAAQRALDADQQRLVATARQAVDAFAAADDGVASGYRAGDAAGRARASELVIGAEIDNYGRAAAALEQLSTALGTRVASATARADADAAGAHRRVAETLVLGLLVAAAVGGVVLLSITRPLSALQQRLIAITDGDGDLTARLPAGGRDELARISRTFNRFVDQLAGLIRSTGEQAAAVASAAQELSATSSTISTTAERSASQARAVSESAGQVSLSVQAAATGSEEMGSAIREIAESANHAAQVADQAVALAGSTQQTMQELGRSSERIGDVIATIKGIAAQTNLLALNATIEAARAGESGKGFAVVAHEVKDLAQETARATDDIGERVLAIQSDAAGAVQVISRIADVVNQISQLQVTIAAAVEEQTATTGEMSRSIGQSAAGTDEIARNVTDLAEAARATTEQASQSQTAVEDLARMSVELRSLVARYAC